MDTRGRHAFWTATVAISYMYAGVHLGRSRLTFNRYIRTEQIAKLTKQTSLYTQTNNGYHDTCTRRPVAWYCSR